MVNPTASTHKRVSPLGKPELGHLEEIRMEVLEAHRGNPEIPTQIALYWHTNVHYGGDGVKRVLEYLKIPEITPPAISEPIPANRGQSSNRQTRPDGHQHKRVVVDKLQQFVDDMIVSHGW